jgi:hypothetical protein
VVTVVVFEVVDSPVGEAFRVGFLMIQGSLVARARHLPGAGVHPEQQVLRVEILCDLFHAAVRAAASWVLPAVVEDNVVVTKVAEARGDEDLGGGEEKVL